MMEEPTDMTDRDALRLDWGRGRELLKRTSVPAAGDRAGDLLEAALILATCSLMGLLGSMTARMSGSMSGFSRSSLERCRFRLGVEADIVLPVKEEERWDMPKALTGSTADGLRTWERAYDADWAGEERMVLLGSAMSSSLAEAATDGPRRSWLSKEKAGRRVGGFLGDAGT